MTAIDLGVLAAPIFSGFAALFALLAFLRSGLRTGEAGWMERFEAAVRAEADLIRRDGHDEARTLRQELTDNSRGFQETALKMFHGLGEGLGSQIKDFGGSVEGKLNEFADKTGGSRARAARGDDGQLSESGTTHRPR